MKTNNTACISVKMKTLKGSFTGNHNEQELLRWNFIYIFDLQRKTFLNQHESYNITRNSTI